MGRGAAAHAVIGIRAHSNLAIADFAEQIRKTGREVAGCALKLAALAGWAALVGGGGGAG